MSTITGLSKIAKKMPGAQHLGSRFDQQRRNELFGFVMFLPALLFLAVLVIAPLSYVVWLSFNEVNILASWGDETWTGLSNYVELLTSSQFHQATIFGVIYAAGTVSVQLVVGLGLALVLNKNIPFSSTIRTLAILPYLVPMISVVLMWKWILDPLYGVLNQLLLELGLIESAISYFSMTGLVIPSLIIASSWKYVAFMALFILARLQTIDDSLYEQARMNGASAWQQFRTVTLPNLRSVILLTVLLRIIFMFNKFDVIYMFTGGGPINRTTNIPIYLYQITFNQMELGTGSAGSVILAIILMCFAAFYFWYYKPANEVINR